MGVCIPNSNSDYRFCPERPDYENPSIHNTVRHFSPIFYRELSDIYQTIPDNSFKFLKMVIYRPHNPLIIIMQIRKSYSTFSNAIVLDSISTHRSVKIDLNVTENISYIYDKVTNFIQNIISEYTTSELNDSSDMLKDVDTDNIVYLCICDHHFNFKYSNDGYHKSCTWNHQLSDSITCNDCIF